MSLIKLSMHALLILPIVIAATIPVPTLPSAILPNGVPNPFYPCPATEVSSCPYRCYTTTSTLISDTSNLTTTTALLDPTCFTAWQVSLLLAITPAICMKCLPPTRKELTALGLIPNTPADPTDSCQPLVTYLDANSSTFSPPSRCGFPGHRIPACAWNCAAAQTPFDVCDSKNTTGTYRLCEKCTPTCSSPRIVFNEVDEDGSAKVAIDKTFSLSNGTCGAGVEERRACPWRCVDAGARGSAYCSLNDKTADFTACEMCL